MNLILLFWKQFPGDQLLFTLKINLFMQSKLSTREVEILKLIIYEYTTVEIARKLYLSCDTVKTYRKNLLNKLKARNVAGLVRKALEHELVLLATKNNPENRTLK